jgi:putative ABC transport system permease protein
VLSFDYWQTAFGSAPDAIGRSMVVNGQSLTVVGVAPKGFSGTTIGSQPDVFVPLTLRGISGRPVENYASRTTYWLYVFARLESGVTIAAGALPNAVCQ